MNTLPPTYDNDIDASNLSSTFVTDESLLEFIFKKGGKVNVQHLSYVLSEYGHKQQVAQNFVNLNAAGLIEYIEWPMARVTKKAKWRRIYMNPFWQFWAAVTTIVSLLLSIIAILLNL